MVLDDSASLTTGNHIEIQLTAPGAHFSARNSISATSDCVLFVVRSFFVDNGNGIMNNNCSAYAGSPLTTVTLAE